MSEQESALPQAELTLVESHLVRSEFQYIAPAKTGPIGLKSSSLNSKVKVRKSSREINVYLDFTTTATDPAVGDLFSVAASYYAAFKATDETTDERLMIFAKLNAPSIIFPSLRAAIAMITLSGGFPALTLPIVNFQKVNTTVELID